MRRGAGGEVFILQARPITALPAPPVRWETPRPGRWVHGGGTIELVTEPISPISETLILPRFDRHLYKWMSRLGLGEAMTWPLIHVINGYMYFAS